MADRQTVLAARSLLNARSIAREHSHAWIGSEHLLLGILALEETVAGQILRAHGIDPETLRTEVANLVPMDAQPARAGLPIADSLRMVLDRARLMTATHTLESVRVEHLLLALLQERAGLGFALLVKNDVDLFDVERELESVVAAPGRGEVRQMGA